MSMSRLRPASATLLMSMKTPRWRDRGHFPPLACTNSISLRLILIPHRVRSRTRFPALMQEVPLVPLELGTGALSFQSTKIPTTIQSSQRSSRPHPDKSTLPHSQLPRTQGLLHRRRNPPKTRRASPSGSRRGMARRWALGRETRVLLVSVSASVLLAMAWKAMLEAVAPWPLVRVRGLVRVLRGIWIMVFFMSGGPQLENWV